MAELRPIGRFEWERLLRRIVMPWSIKSLGLLLSTYADPDGTRVRPGLDALAAVTEESERTVRRKMAVLRDDYGLLLLVSRGGGRGGTGRTTDYRLAIPVDLLERAELLPPREHAHESPDTQMSGQSTESPDTQMSGQSNSTPVDNSDSPDTWVSAQSYPQGGDGAESPDIWVSHENDFHRTNDHFDRTPRCPTTTHLDQPPKEPSPYSPTDVTTNSAREAEQNDLPGDGQPRASPAPAKCAHGLPANRHPDDTPTCPLCRRLPEEPP